MLNISISSIFAAILFGAVGLWMLREGKRKGDMRVVVIGLLLMTYGYVSPNPWFDWGIGAGLCYLAYHIWN